MAMTGPETSSIALMVASCGDMPCSMWCSTASTTTMASSTTSPMASTSPNSDRVLMEKPSIGKDDERSDQRDRHREQRDQRGPPALKEDVDHENDQDQSLAQGLVDLVDAFADRQRGIERDVM